MAAEKPLGPAVIAVFHESAGITREGMALRNKKIRVALAALLRSAPAGRAFIEGSQSGAKRKIFAGAAKIASSLGYEVVALDRLEFSRIFTRMRKSRLPMLSAEAYVMNNLREKYWAEKIAQFGPARNDVAVMHPNHVRGFLANASFRPAKVVRIDRLLPKERVYTRLSREWLARLQKERENARKNRQAETRWRKLLVRRR